MFRQNSVNETNATNMRPLAELNNIELMSKRGSAANEASNLMLKKLVFGATAIGLATFAVVNASERLTSDKVNDPIIALGAVAAVATLHERDKQRQARRVVSSTTYELLQRNSVIIQSGDPRNFGELPLFLMPLSDLAEARSDAQFLSHFDQEIEAGLLNE